MVAFVDGVPRTVNLRDAIDGYVRHQIEVITRRSNFRLDKARRPERTCGPRGLRGAYARGVDPSEHEPGVKPGVRRRTPVRVPGERDTAEVPTVGPDTASLDLPDIVPTGPKTERTKVAYES